VGKYVTSTPVARQVPFDPTGTPMTSLDVNSGIIESYNSGSAALGAGRYIYGFWEFTGNASTYLYGIGQVKTSDAPFVIARNLILTEITAGLNANATGANIFFAIYRTVGTNVVLPTIGSLASATNQALTYQEGDFPYTGTTRVTVNIVNNGPSLPLAFSENTTARTVTIQLATNGGGTVTTTRTQLRDAFRLNTTITQIYSINGTGGTIMTPASFTLAGGAAGNAIASIFTRNREVQYRTNYNVNLAPGDQLFGYTLSVDNGSFSQIGVQTFMNPRP
jgi:hypothetical protein